MSYTIATKRIRRILVHASGCEDVPPPNSYFSAMNCSSTLNSMDRRDDDRTLFVPQDSVSQTGFIQPASAKEQSHGSNDSSEQNLPFNFPSSGFSSYQNQEEPLFSRKVRENSSFPDSRDVHSSKQDSVSSSTDALKFTRSISEKMEEKPVYSRTSRPSISDVDTGLVWSPRIDVAESSSSYFVIVELPGVNINGIRVEVNDHNLTITGKRILQQKWRMMTSSEDSNLTYHHKEILQGPYEVNWPLPNDVNKDHISAEFVDGFLQIVIPKSKNAETTSYLKNNRRSHM